MPSDGKVSSYVANVRRRIWEMADPAQFFQPSNQLGAFADFDVVHATLHQLDVVNKMCANMTSWTNPVVLKAAIHRYDEFISSASKMAPGITLVSQPQTSTSSGTRTRPSPWTTRPFARKSAHTLVDHDDTIGNGDLRASYADTSQVFGEPYSSYPPN
ncbi:hypothetical protein H310_04279 [Aphanomyces invadans]|uniref:Uncharacterized protein n=1 Tax=Aphanomyces invadans TaxID=157072 RepID=A0A024UGL2_9STRA|nr:hypothetical protein H310_04279 [Aphanomyces invadans]ETW05340.1 hypothetical protein H310_04279 [Aphanomyces invadans]|eukprot:XP_008866778.1 hypothetical protein H310_04279 [Aphanomyces invadans]